jgi:flagellar hook-associated protein 2
MASSVTASSSIDVQGIVASLMKVERKPLDQMKAETTRIETKLSAFGKLKSAVATFRDAAAELARADTWRSVKATSASPQAVEVTARPGAAATQHAVSVTQLAQSQTLTSGRFASGDAVVGGGTLRIQLGERQGGGAFVADPARAEVAITVAPGATLAQVRDAINASGSGARAAIVRDGDQVRLFLTGAESGGNQAFRVSATNEAGLSDGSGLSALAFDPGAPAGGGLTQMRAASDAQYTVDGVSLTARSNRIAGALDGVDLVLRQVTPAPVQIDVTVDTEGLEAATKKFVDAYNALNTLIGQQTGYDAATRTAGPLQADRTAVGIQGRIRSIVLETVSGGTLSRLADVGIQLQRDGSLAMKSETFRSAAVDPSRLQALFSASGTTATDRGLMLRFRDLGDQLGGSDGSMTAATNAWTARKAEVAKRQSALENRMTDVERRLLRQYSALDAQLAQAQQMGAALGSALAGLPKIE